MARSGRRSRPQVLAFVLAGSLFVFSLPIEAQTTPGDSNGDGVVNVADLFYLINHLFSGGPPPVGRSDTNGDGSLSPADVLYFLNHLFAAGPAPLPGTGRYRLLSRGLWVHFERRGWPSEYWNGQVVRELNNFDSVVGSTVQAEVSLQLDRMREMGINTINFEIRATDAAPGSFTFPECNIHPALGFPWPQPTSTELTNLRALFDLIHAKGMKVFLGLTNTHMEEQPPTGNQTWVGAILNAVKDHPALDLILFHGNERHIDNNGDTVNDSCGIPAEAPLWMGPQSVGAEYLKWAINYARSLGIPAGKLSAEAIVGDFITESEPANQFATDGHLWSPIRSLKQIFDDLAIPQIQRTYGISMFSQRKCKTAGGQPCVDGDPHTWAIEMMQKVTTTVGAGARIAAGEMGLRDPIDPGQRTEHGMESLVSLFETYGLEGGAFWRWASFETQEDSNPTLADPVKRRGSAFTYNPVANEILDMGGFHLRDIPNGSFETGDATPSGWIASGDGTVSRYDLMTEAGQPEVLSRGRYALRLMTGSNATSVASASSSLIAATPEVQYTTAMSLRFGWTGDPNPGAAPASRPHVAITVQYFDANQMLVVARPEDVFRYFQENATSGFDTFAIRYTAPSGTSFVKIVVTAARNSLPSAIVLDADAVR